MKSLSLRGIVFVSILFMSITRTFAADTPQEIVLWEKGAPGETGNIGEEKDTTKPTDNMVDGRKVIRTGFVSKPTLTIYRPAKDKDTGCAAHVHDDYERSPGAACALVSCPSAATLQVFSLRRRIARASRSPTTGDVNRR